MRADRVDASPDDGASDLFFVFAIFFWLLIYSFVSSSSALHAQGTVVSLLADAIASGLEVNVRSGAGAFGASFAPRVLEPLAQWIVALAKQRATAPWNLQLRQVKELLAASAPPRAGAAASAARGGGGGAKVTYSALKGASRRGAPSLHTVALFTADALPAAPPPPREGWTLGHLKIAREVLLLRHRSAARSSAAHAGGSAVRWCALVSPFDRAGARAVRSRSRRRSGSSASSASESEGECAECVPRPRPRAAKRRRP